MTFLLNTKSPDASSRPIQANRRAGIGHAGLVPDCHASRESVFVELNNRVCKVGTWPAILPSCGIEDSRVYQMGCVSTIIKGFHHADRVARPCSLHCIVETIRWFCSLSHMGTLLSSLASSLAPLLTSDLTQQTEWQHMSAPTCRCSVTLGDCRAPQKHHTRKQTTTVQIGKLQQPLEHMSVGMTTQKGQRPMWNV